MVANAGDRVVALHVAALHITTADGATLAVSLTSSVGLISIFPLLLQFHLRSNFPPPLIAARVATDPDQMFSSDLFLRSCGNAI
jgi:hypothetical protein